MTTDNLSIKGIDPAEQTPGRRVKIRGKRKKLWGIETRTLHKKPRKYSVFYSLKLDVWHGFSKYETPGRRDQAYAALVKTAENNHLHLQYGILQEYRKVDYDGTPAVATD